MLGSNSERAHEPLVVFGVNLSSLPLSRQFMVLASGNLFCSLGFAFLQEKVFLIEGFQYAGFMTFLTTLTFALCGLAERTLSNEPARKASMKEYAALSVLTMGGMYFTNWSLTYLNYPSRVMFKSCKVIPVMMMGVVMQKLSYSWMEYGSAGILVLGIIVFLLGDSQVQPNFDMRGVLLISLGVIFDAITSNFEEHRFFRLKNCSQAEVMMYSSALGSVYAFISLVQTGELSPAIAHATEHPEVVPNIVMFSMLGYLSVIFVLLTIKRFGATNAEIVKSFRKVMSIIISFVFIAKPFRPMHILGGALFLGSIVISVRVKSQRKRGNSRGIPDDPAEGIKLLPTDTSPTAKTAAL